MKIPFPSPSYLVALLVGLIALSLSGAEPARNQAKEEIVDLPKLRVKGIPVSSYGIGVVGTRDPATNKIRRLLIDDVISGTEAERLGLQEHDEILALNGVPVTEMDGLMKPGSQLFDLLMNQSGGQKMILEVLSRRAKSVTLTATPVGTLLIAPTKMYPPHYVSVSIDRSPDDVYAFVMKPENLPKWASGLGTSIKRVDGAWISDSPMGKVKIEFVKKNAVGVLDHEVTLPSGVTVYNPMRVQPNGTASEVVFTLYRLPTLSAEQFQADATRVRADLERLKTLLEK